MKSSPAGPALVGTGSLFDRMAALADPIRARLLLVLEGNELAVAELCAIFQLPQSTVSRHLKSLMDEGLLAVRTEGPSRRYRMLVESLDDEGAALWELVRERTGGLVAAQQDRSRLKTVLAERRSRSREFFSSAAGEWDRLRTELFGRRADLLALLGLLDEGCSIGDLGCGTGQIAASLAPFVSRVVAVDDSPEMLDAAQHRLSAHDNVELRRGTLEDLPIPDGELDAAVVFLVLDYVVDPARAVEEAARVLKPGGRLLVADMAPHQRQEYRQQMGHLWQGFGREEVGGWMERAGLERFRYVPLPPDSEAKGPSLFVATARKREDPRSRRDK